jgi:predicted SnoaL-like aldol condensation-catalyzing enzyme
MALAGTFRARRMCSVGTAENKAVQRRIIDEVINRKNLDLADELFSEEHELHPEAAGVTRGPEGMKRAFAGLHEEFPDIRVEIESMVAEGDMVAVRLTFSGTTRPPANGTGGRRWSSRASPRARQWRVGR